MKIYKDDRGEFRVHKSTYNKDGMTINVREQEYEDGGPSRFKFKVDCTLGFQEGERQHYERKRGGYGPPLHHVVVYETQSLMRDAMAAAMENHKAKKSQNTTEEVHDQ